MWQIEKNVQNTHESKMKSKYLSFPFPFSEGKKYPHFIPLKLKFLLLFFLVDTVEILNKINLCFWYIRIWACNLTSCHGNWGVSHFQHCPSFFLCFLRFSNSNGYLHAFTDSPLSVCLLHWVIVHMIFPLYSPLTFISTTPLFSWILLYLFLCY